MKKEEQFKKTMDAEASKIVKKLKIPRSIVATGAKRKKKKKPKRRKVRVFCRLYKYVCAACGKNRHMRHSIEIGQICPRCEKLQPPADQASLFN